MTGNRPIAFVLSGGSVLGACEVGMLAALSEAGIRPDMVLGSSVGAAVGAVYASTAESDATAAAYAFWMDFMTTPELSWSIPRTLYRLTFPIARKNAHDSLEALLGRHLKVQQFEKIPTHFECNGLQIPALREQWFSTGPVVPALLAAAAAPGIVAPTRIGEDIYFDGGLIDPIPLDRALELGARTIYVLQITDFEVPVEFPQTLWKAGPLETALRYRFQRNLDKIPPGTEVHLLPTGRKSIPHGISLLRRLYGLDLKQQLVQSEQHIDQAYRATAAYLRFESLTGMALRKKTRAPTQE
jgi:NTE family protein